MKKEITCRCDAYPYPHRIGSGACDRKHLPELPPDPMDLARDETIRKYEDKQEKKDE